MSGPSEIEIVAERGLRMREVGTLEWHVTEYSGGRYQLTTNAAGTRSHTYFEADEWAAYQALIAGYRGAPRLQDLAAGTTPVKQRQDAETRLSPGRGGAADPFASAQSFETSMVSGEIPEPGLGCGPA